MTSYQKLKDENERLKENIRILIYRPNSIEAMLIRLNDNNHQLIMNAFADRTKDETGVTSVFVPKASADSAVQ